jgi:hypothetical protein
LETRQREEEVRKFGALSRNLSGNDEEKHVKPESV